MSHLRDSKPKAAKKHRCILCSWDILVGAVHVQRVSVDGGIFQSLRMHVECEALAENWTADDWDFHDPQDFRELLARHTHN